MELGPLPPKLEFDLSRNQVLRFTTDEYGSDILICMLQKRDPELIEMMLSETIKRIPKLMVHPIASLFVGKLIEVCDGDQWLRILDRIILSSRHLSLICYNNYGANGVQKMLKRLTEFLEKYPALKASLNGHIFRFLQSFVASASIIGLARDTNAHHLLHYCLKNLPVKSIGVLLTEIEYYWLALATDKSGCYILQLCVDKAEGIFRDRLLSNIITHASELARDPYGNYVVQHVLQLNNRLLGLRIVDQLRGSFASLSFDKFASHLVKKCLILTHEANPIILELLESPSLSRLVFDPYGNSVLMFALYVSKVTQVDYDDEYLKMRVTSILKARKDDISCLDVIDEFERVMSMSLLMH